METHCSFSGIKMSEKHSVEEIFNLASRIGAGSSLFVAFIAGLTGNLIVISTVLIIIRRKKEIPNLLILLLAIVDCCTVTVNYLQPIITYIYGSHLGGEVTCILNTASILFFNAFTNFVFIGMIYDRYFAVAKPYCYQDRMIFTKMKVTLFIVTCSFISLLITLPTILGFSKSVLQYPETYCLFTLHPTTSSEKFMLIFYVLILTVILLLVVLGNVSGSIHVWKMFTYRERFFTVELSFRGSEEYLFIRLSVITMGIFLVIWLPIYIQLCLSLSNTTYPEWYGMSSARLAALQSVVNPWLHPALRRKFRKSFKWVFQSFFSCITCRLVTKPTYSLEHILKDEQHYTQKARKSIIDEQEHNEFATNVLFNLAQRNIIDYVDAPDMYGYGPDTFRSYGDTPETSQTPPLKHLTEEVLKSTLGTFGIQAAYETGEFHMIRDEERGKEEDINEGFSRSHGRVYDLDMTGSKGKAPR